MLSLSGSALSFSIWFLFPQYLDRIGQLFFDVPPQEQPRGGMMGGLLGGSLIPEITFSHPVHAARGKVKGFGHKPYIFCWVFIHF